MAPATPQTGYAPVNGLNMYYEIYGSGQPLVVLHGGLGMTGMFGELLPQLATHHQVIAVDLQAHGRTADIDRPLRLEHMADDIAALLAYLGHKQADIFGYSMGGGVALRTAIQYPAIITRLALLSVPFRRNGWYPEILAGMGQMNRAAAEFMKNTPMYQAYIPIAPRPEDFPVLLDKMGDLLHQDYDWSAEVAALKMPTLLIYGDADSVPPSHAVEFFELLGGGKRDGNWDGSGMSAAQLAILPATTHYTAFISPALPSIITPFLDAPLPQL